MAPFRTSASTRARFGLEVDRAEPVGFRIGSRNLSALYGDSLASGLMANGVRIVGRSPLLGRPRGVMALGLEDHMPASVEGDRGPWSLVSGDEILLREGLRASSGGLVVERALRRFTPPAAPERRGLPAVQQMMEALRRALPLPGPRLPPVEPPPFARRHSCDALVIGAGLAGLSAAAALRSAGLDVRVVEATRRAGGMADLYDGRIDGRSAAEWAGAQAGDLRGRDALLLGATAIDIATDGLVTVIERLDPQRPGHVALKVMDARAVVVATGWRERPLIFPDNDRPGVMLAGAARAMLRRYAVAPGRRLIVATTGDEGYRAAMDFRDAGVEVDFVVDARADPQGSAVDVAKALGAPISLATLVVGLEYDERRSEITGVRTQFRFGEGASAATRVLPADALLVSGGFVPRDELMRRCALGAEDGVHLAQSSPNLADAVAGGWGAGAAAAAQLGAPVARPEPSVEATADDPAETVPPSPGSFRSIGGSSAFVDFSADVTLADIARAVDLRGLAPEAIGRRLGLGLGPDGGRLSADLAGLAFESLGGADGPFPAKVGRATLGQLAARSSLLG